MPGQAIVRVNVNEWAVSLATTYAELEWGLSGVLSMPAGTGMLFVLPADRSVGVTTKPMLFNIDIIFISSALEVVDVARNVAPGNIVTEGTPVRYFLEVNAGEAADIESGDMVGIAVYQMATNTLTNWISPVVSFAGVVMIGAMLVNMGKTMADAMFSKPKEKPVLYGPREERLLLQTDYDKELEQLRRDLREDAISEEAYKRAAGEILARKHKPYRSDVMVEAWQERDRLGIWITDNRTGESIAEWWDNEAREMFEQGWFKPGVPQYSWEKPSREFVASVLDYAERVGLLAKGGSPGTVPEYLPQTSTATKLDGLQIVKAYKQVSRHGEDKISVSLQAWAIFPRGRRPHMISMYRSGDEYVISPLYAHVSEWVRVPVEKVKAWIKSLPIKHFEPMAVAPEKQAEAERLAREVDMPIDIVSLSGTKALPTVIPAEQRPIGTCYEDAWRFLIMQEEGELVHGTVLSLGKRIGHAWVELPSGYIWEPRTASYFTFGGFEAAAEPIAEHRYTVEEAAIMAARMKNLGPWDEQERRQYLKEKSPAVIPTEPSPRPPRPRDELEFIADSPEFLAYTIQDIGYRDKLDTVFQTAIARAKGVR